MVEIKLVEHREKSSIYFGYPLIMICQRNFGTEIHSNPLSPDPEAVWRWKMAK